MKTKILLWCCGLFLIASCVKMEEVHEKYVDGGEIIYRAKPLEIEAFPGFNRVLLKWKLVSPAFVERCEISENGVVLAKIPVTYDDVTYIEHILDNVTEGTHTFDIYSYDNEGNSSTCSQVIVEIYGTNYSKLLRTTTTMKSVWRKADDRKQALVNISERTSLKVAGTKLTYLNTAGKEESVEIEPDVTRVELADVAENSTFTIQDLYHPVEGCIDAFPAPAERVDVIPAMGARTFSLVYKTDKTTLYGQLTAAETGTLKTIIRCGNQEIEVDPDVNEVTMENVNPKDNIMLETTLENEAGDVEYIAPQQIVNGADINTKINMTDWEVIEFSSEQAGENKAQCCIDGRLDTYWHTEYSPNKSPYPHFIIVDMKESTQVKAIAIARRQNNNNIAFAFTLELSEDGESWTQVDKFSVSNAINGLQYVPLKEWRTGRYFRLTGVSSSTANFYMCLGEANLFN